MKKVFLEISQNSQGNACAGVSFLIKFFYKKETLVAATGIGNSMMYIAVFRKEQIRQSGVLKQY